MIILDTNVVSEVMRDAAELKVTAWLDAQLRESLFLTAVSEAELRFGVAILPAGRRRDTLAAAVETTTTRSFAGRILPFDSAAARIYAEIVAVRRAAGRPMAQSDAQIAAIARCRGMALATRNTRDFEGCELSLIDPWTV